MRFDLQWQKAEDTFLRQFCDIKEFGWGRRYSWDQGDDWAKFNFIRILDPGVDARDLKVIIDEQRAFFARINRGVNLKVPSTLKARFDPEGFGPLTGVPICYGVVKVEELPDIPYGPRDFRICQDVEDLKTWWLINSDGRTRSDPFDSPLWPIVMKKFDEGSRYVITYDKTGEPVAGCAVDQEDDIFNAWGGAVKLAHQKQGFFKLTLCIIKNEIVKGLDEIHTQVNLGSAMHRYYLRLSSSRFMCQENRYVVA